MKTPYLSVVMGIGGNMTADLLARLRASAHNTLALADRHGLSMELIVVEWNMPDDSPSVADLIDWPRSLNPVRVIQVPAELHRLVPNPHGFRYFEWYPKNIGIRRARGRFVLSTNPDDIFSSEMIGYLAEQKLKCGTFYRANRYDYRDSLVYLICRSNGTFWPGMSEEQIRLGRSPGATPWNPHQTHYCASGDFTLMAKADWHLIHGNPEREYNHTIDGQTLWLAMTKGLSQEILPYPIYHPDHIRTLNHAYLPTWDDAHPHAKENDDWGFPNLDFVEVTPVCAADPEIAVAPTMPALGSPRWRGWPEPMGAGRVLIQLLDPRLKERNGEYAWALPHYAKRFVDSGQAVYVESENRM